MKKEEILLRQLVRESIFDWIKSFRRPAERQISGEELSQKILARIDRAASLKFALADIGSETEKKKIVVLYNPEFIASLMSSLLESKPSGERKQVYDKVLFQMKAAAKEAVIGGINLKMADEYGPCDGAAVVKFSVSKEGYGPMLYDIAMSLSPNGKIMSDREAVSTGAANVYKGFHNRPDIKKRKFYDISAPPEMKLTPDDPTDDCMVWRDTKADREFLDYSFARTSQINTEKLILNHQTVASMVQTVFVSLFGEQESSMSLAWLDVSLANAATNFFGSEYGKLPSDQLGLKR